VDDLLPSSHETPALSQRRNAPSHPTLLPKSNPFQPFAVASETHSERLAPAAQFLLLFVLFTAAGTSLMLIGRSATGDRAASSADHRLEQVDPAVAVPTAVTHDPPLESSPPAESQLSTPTAAGPARDVTRVQPGSPSWPSFDTGPISDAPTNERVPSVARVDERRTEFEADLPEQKLSDPPTTLRQTTNPTTDAQAMPYPSTGKPPIALPTASANGTLPQVRTDDPPTAVATLKGSVTPVRTR
jgi:hypothetical protein